MKEQLVRRFRALWPAVALFCASVVLLVAAQPGSTRGPPQKRTGGQSGRWVGPMGAFSVGEDGAAQYSLPLWIPKGRRDAPPELALSYNSRSGNGLLGVGWSLQGLSTIAPCDRTFAQDGFRDGVHFQRLGRAVPGRQPAAVAHDHSSPGDAL